MLRLLATGALLTIGIVWIAFTLAVLWEATPPFQRRLVLLVLATLTVAVIVTRRA